MHIGPGGAITTGADLTESKKCAEGNGASGGASK